MERAVDYTLVSEIQQVARLSEELKEGEAVKLFAEVHWRLILSGAHVASGYHHLSLILICS